jgi:alpha-galactosidase
LEGAERDGTHEKINETKGAARLHTKTVAQMTRDAAEARDNAAAADKGKMTKGLEHGNRLFRR